MRGVLKLLALLVVLIAAFIGVFLVANHSAVGDPGDVKRVAQEGLPSAGDTLEIVTWNLGYGGLGAGSDFVADGGEHYFPPSRAAARANAAGIRAFLETQTSADIVMLQELAGAGPVNYWTDVHREADAALASADRIFFADFKTRFMPWPLRMVHGQGIYARRAVAETDLVALPAENSGILGVRRRYAATVARLPIAGREHGWTIVTTHLAAFDDDAIVRTRQLRELLAWAEAEYRAGQHVVIGGDFNLRLAETNFPNTTEERFLFWVYPFPPDALPEGWRIGADASTPSVRTNERPYRPGENYTTVIDGFIVSPNVSLEHVAGVDLGFAHSDHNPVQARVRALPPVPG
jgi:endonuclease/exonuclease/phosphatase family metal-dependent hydrolase